MRSIDQKFYSSKEWKQCRKNYIEQHPLCERCLSKGLVVPADIVHHTIYLSDENYFDPSIAYNFENLEAVCKQCHNTEHFGDKQPRRWMYVDGELITKD